MKTIIKRFRDLRWWEKPFAILGFACLIPIVIVCSPIIIFTLCGATLSKVINGEDDYPSY